MRRNQNIYESNLSLCSASFDTIRINKSVEISIAEEYLFMEKGVQVFYKN